MTTQATPTLRPPAHAWDWFDRQRLLWRTTRERLARATATGPTADRYQRVEDKVDVGPLLRQDYLEDAVVRDVVHAVISELVFLGRVDEPFAALGARNAPRGMRWWWTAITGEEIDAPVKPGPPAKQLALSEILQGYGDHQ